MALTQDPANLITDPLALRFMTGEQMGYMPQAQYLTPSEYGAFRTLPGPQGHNYLHQDPGFLQSLLIRSRGSLGFMPTYTFNTYNPAVNLQQYMYHMRARSDDSLMAGGGVFADILSSMGVGMLLGGVPGLAAGMLMPDISKPMLDRIRDMRGIQNMSMSKIVGGVDVNQVTGAGFNAASARSLDSFLRASSAGDALLKQGDWRKLLQLGIEYGQFDYAGNADQYKDALKKLRKSITTVMEVAGSTDFKDILKEYKRMRTMGADLSEYTNIMRKEDMYSRITGLSHADMVNTYGQQGALIYQQAGLTGYQGSLQAMHNAASITLMQRAGLLSPGALSRYGGISGLTQAMTQQDATAQNRIIDFLVPYFMKDDASGLDDSKSLSDLLNSNDTMGMVGREAARKTRTLDQRMRYDRNRGNLLQELQERYGQENITATFALNVGHEVGLKGLEALQYGYRQFGYDPQIAYMKAQRVISSDFREQEERELQLARRKQREERDLAESPFRKFALTLDKTFTRWGENIFGGLTSSYVNWTERRARNAEGQYDTGDNMHLSPDQLNALKKLGYDPSSDGLGPESPKGPAPHPVTNLKELAEPAEKFYSGGDSGKISWREKEGTRYGLFSWSAEQMKDFGEWVKKLGPKGADWARRFEKAGGFKNFGSLEEAQNSEISKVLAELSKDEDFARKQREYVNERYYEPSKAAMEPGNLAELMSTKTGQQMLYMETAQGTKITRLPSRKVYPAGTLLGEISAKYESGPQGMAAIGHDKTGGTSYGKFQLSTTHVENKKVVDGGSYQGWLNYIEKKGGEWAEIAKKLRSAGPLNTGSRSGAAVDAYRIAIKGREKLFEESQREYLMKTNYRETMSGIKSPSLRSMIEKDRGLQEMVFSTAVQHGGPAGAGILNKVYREGMTRDELIDAVYDERGTRFPSSSQETREAVRERFRNERVDVKNTAPSSYSGPQGDLAAAMSAEIADITQDAITKGVKYHMNKNGEKGPRSIDEGATDCSGWVMETGAKMMRGINRKAGAEVFSERDIEDLTTAGTSENIIKVFHKKTGELLDKSQLTPDKARAGMFIGLDTGPTEHDRERTIGIDHIVQTYIDPKTGELMVSQSSSSGGGVTSMRYVDWYKSLKASTKLYGVDMTRIAKSAKLRPGQGGGIPGVRLDVKSAAADVVEEAMKAGNGKITPEVVKTVMERGRKEAAGNKERLEALDQIEQSLLGALNVDNRRRAYEESERNADKEKREKWDKELKDIYQRISGEMAANYDELKQAWGFDPNQGKDDYNHLTQVVRRYKSGLDKNADGGVSYNNLFNLLSATIKRETGKDINLNKIDFKNEVERFNTLDALKNADTEKKAIEHVKKILGSANLSLSKEEIEVAANDPVFRAAVLSAGIHTLSENDEKGIIDSFIKRAEDAQINEHGKELSATEEIYLKHIEEASEVMLPGINSLGSEYKEDIKVIKYKAFRGEDSTPFVLNAARLSLLKRLAQDPKVGGIYEEQFRIEAKRNGFDDAWIKEQLASADDIGYAAFVKNKDFASLTKDDIANINKVNSGLYTELRKYPVRKKDVIDNYEANLVNKNVPLTRQQATYLVAKQMTDVNRFAKYLNMDAKELLTDKGLEKASRKLKDGGLGSAEQVKLIDDARRKLKEGKKIDFTDLIVLRGSKYNSSDEYTITAGEQARNGQQLSRTISQEERQRTRPAPEAQQRKKEDNPSKNAAGTPLKDETVRDLERAITALIEFLQGQETKKR